MPDKNLKDEQNRQPPPLTNAFRGFVTKELTRRKNDIPVPITAPFTRLTSCLEEPNEKYRFFTMGLDGYNYLDELFSITYGSDREIVGYAYKDGKKTLIDVTQLSARSFENFGDQAADQIKNIQTFANMQQSLQDSRNIVAKGTYPLPGIVSVRIERYAMTTGIRALVTWTCFGRQQLEFLRHHFMTVGSTVVLEWGQNITSYQPKEMLNFSDNEIEDILVRCFKEGRKYINPNYVEPNQGNYDFIVGTIGNFTIEFDANTNMYTVGTVIHSAGEMLWGMRNQYTAIDVETTNNQVQTFEDYFKQGSRFDTLMTSVSENSDSDVTIPYMEYKNTTASESQDFSSLSAYPNDWRFISWKFFAKDLMADMMEYFTTNKKIREDVGDFIKFYDETVKIEVGNNPYLMSTTPESLIIVRKDYKEAEVSVPDEFVGNGYFDDYHPSDRGVLTQGIWINAQLVRNAFLTTPTVQNAIEMILANMNNATAGYWGLALHYDEESSCYRVVDSKFGKLKKDEINTTGNPIYVFNVGSRSELMKLEFDAAFPPEVAFQLATSARLLQNPEMFAETLKKYPLIGQTSHYAFGMNWTNYEDIIQKKLQNKKPDNPNENSNRTTGPIPFGQQVGEVRQTSRFMTDFGSISGLVKSGQTGDPTEPASFGDALSDISNQPNTTLSTPKNDGIPQAAADTIKKFIVPVTYTAISSRFLLSRVSPIDGTVKPHKGIDYAAPEGTPVFAAGAGRIITSRRSDTAGNFIEIQHSNGVVTRYMHMSVLNVNVGQNVSSGQKIGEVGSTGRSNGNHLHYEIVVNGRAIDPEKTPKISTQNTLPANPSVQQPNEVADTNSQQRSNANDPYAARRDEVATKFGNSIAAMINVNGSEMTRNIIRDGIDNHQNRLSNNFIAPFPTLVKIELTLQGVSGISYFDGFLVDKLPYIYENYGMFQVVGITENIDKKNGWLTMLKGVYRFMYFDGSLNDNVLTTKNQLGREISKTVLSLGNIL